MIKKTLVGLALGAALISTGTAADRVGTDGNIAPSRPNFPSYAYPGQPLPHEPTNGYSHFGYPAGWWGGWWGTTWGDRTGPIGYTYEAPREADPSGYSQYWHYCRKAQAYYPYVKQCPDRWEAVQPSLPPVLGRW
jgi:hypothetical protein